MSTLTVEQIRAVPLSDIAVVLTRAGSIPSGTVTDYETVIALYQRAGLLPTPGPKVTLQQIWALDAPTVNATLKAYGLTPLNTSGDYSRLATLYYQAGQLEPTDASYVADPRWSNIMLYTETLEQGLAQIRAAAKAPLGISGAVKPKKTYSIVEAWNMPTDQAREDLGPALYADVNRKSWVPTERNIFLVQAYALIGLIREDEVDIVKSRFWDTLLHLSPLSTVETYIEQVKKNILMEKINVFSGMGYIASSTIFESEFNYYGTPSLFAKEVYKPGNSLLFVADRVRTFIRLPESAFFRELNNIKTPAQIGAINAYWNANPLPLEPATTDEKLKREWYDKYTQYKTAINNVGLQAAWKALMPYEGKIRQDVIARTGMQAYDFDPHEVIRHWLNYSKNLDFLPRTIRCSFLYLVKEALLLFPDAAQDAQWRELVGTYGCSDIFDVKVKEAIPYEIVPGPLAGLIEGFIDLPSKEEIEARLALS